MRPSIKLHVWKAWLSAASREAFEVEWRDEITLRDLVPARLRGSEGLRVYVNGDRRESLDVQPSPGDFVDVAVIPGLDPISEYALWQIILIGTAVNFGLSLIINWILGKPKGPKSRGDEESAHAAWGGVQNVRTEGQPRQITYGRFRNVPQVIDEFVVTTPSPATSVLYTLFAIGEGSVYRIGDQLEDNPTDTPLSSEDPDNPLPTGIQVNGNSLESYRNVEVHVRMGTSDQEPIPGFEKLVIDYAVGAKLNQDEAATNAAQQTLHPDLDLSLAHPYDSDSAESQAVWDVYGFGFDLRERADQFTCLVQFPGGLFCVDSVTGSLTDAAFRCLIRYRELDDVGIEIETGGNNGDGWVYIYPEQTLFAHTQQPFGKEFSGVFQDPQNYVPSALGRSVSFDGANDYGTTDLGANDSLLQRPVDWAAGSNPEEITIVGWAQFNGLAYGLSAAYRPLLEITYPGTPNRGIAIFLERHVRGSDNQNAFWLPTVYVGNNSAIHSFSEQGTSRWSLHYVPATTGLSDWHHFAVTYKNLGSSVRITIYLDGIRVYATTTSFAAAGFTAAGHALELARSRTFVPSAYSLPIAYSHVSMDEWRVLNREMSAADIADDYGSGAGKYGIDEDELVAGWHFEEAPGVATMQDYGNYGNATSPNDLRLLNGATTGLIGSGRVSVPGSGPAKRSRYRVQMVRLNLKGAGTFIGDDSVWGVVMGKVSAVLAYPNMALLATKIRANDQLQGEHPTTTVLTDGILCPVWDGNSTKDPSITYQWTRNPAWICLDVATNKRYGRGADYNFFTVNLPSVKEWADYNDELIYDNRGRRQTIGEDPPSTTSDIVDLRYDSTLFDGFGGIEVFFRSSASVHVPPRHWAAGGFIGFTDIPAPSSSYVVDINGTNISGFEIGSIVWNGGAWVVTIKFDKVTYGHPWTDGQFLSTYIALTGTAEGRERRFEYNWVHDTFKGVWDTLVDIASTARAMPFRDGKILRFKVEKPRTAVGIIGMGQIVPGSFEMDYVGGASRPNSITADFWDQDQNYDRVPTSMDDPVLTPDTNEEDMNRDGITIEGVTRRSQVRRDILFRLLVNRLLARSGKFRTGLDTLPYEAGDVFQLSHDIVPWGKSGRLLAASTTTNLYVDRSITLFSGKTYYAKVRSNGQALAADGTVTDRYDTVQVTAASGIYASGAAISINALSFTPAKDDPYMIYATDEIVFVQIASVSLGENTDRLIEWIDYDEAVYDCDVLPEDIKS